MGNPNALIKNRNRPDLYTAPGQGGLSYNSNISIEEQKKILRAADEAEMAALVERNKQVLDLDNTAHRSAKVSGATVSAIGDANRPNDDSEERPLTLDDIE